jgi:hypothetical protein
LIAQVNATDKQAVKAVGPRPALADVWLALSVDQAARLDLATALTTLSLARSFMGSDKDLTKAADSIGESIRKLQDLKESANPDHQAAWERLLQAQEATANEDRQAADVAWRKARVLVPGWANNIILQRMAQAIFRLPEAAPEAPAEGVAPSPDMTGTESSGPEEAATVEAPTTVEDTAIESDMPTDEEASVWHTDSKTPGGETATTPPDSLPDAASGGGSDGVFPAPSAGFQKALSSLDAINGYASRKDAVQVRDEVAAINGLLKDMSRDERATLSGKVDQVMNEVQWVPAEFINENCNYGYLRVLKYRLNKNE